MATGRWLLSMTAVVCLLCSCELDAEATGVVEAPVEEAKGEVKRESTETLALPVGLQPVPWPADNPYSARKAELGKLLYFDKRLSSDGTVSCASCHQVASGFADHTRVARGIEGRKGSRNSPTLINTAYQQHLFWDGRAGSLEEQAKGPIANDREMTLAATADDAHRQCQERIQTIAGYRTFFKEVFGSEDCSVDDIAKAIATFERTLLSGNSPYDRYMAGDKTAMTPEQIEGFMIFKKAACIACHRGFNFTEGRFANIGVGMDKPTPDVGRYAITKDPKDWGAFKTPTLRDVSRTYPYMHDGSLATLEEVVEYYDRGGIPNKKLDSLIRPLGMTPEQKKALVSFLRALDGEGWESSFEPKQIPN